ncbi:MAG: hypothetical protein H0Z33_03340 [Bacillaceae bacterium]|nr:hypothetical protein [Bacillaceae bacterium]
MKSVGKMSVAYWTGVLSSVIAVLLWAVLVFWNPYSSGSIESDVFWNTLVTLFAPAVLALIAALTRKVFLMVFAFIWSLPMSLYMLMTPGIFKLFALVSLLYLLSAILLNRVKKPQNK